MKSDQARAFIFPLLAWGNENQRSFPWRREQNPFRVLVAEVLLQRSRSTTVEKVYEDLFSKWDSPRSLAKAPLSELENVIRPLGLIGRARSLQALAAQVEKVGVVPSDPNELMTLPGVGRYAATATAVAAFDSKEAVVDSVSARVYRRYFGLPESLAPSLDKDLWRAVGALSSEGHFRELNWAALDLAAAICLPKVPRCTECPLRPGCVRGNALSAPAARVSSQPRT